MAAGKRLDFDSINRAALASLPVVIVVPERFA